MKIIGTHVCVKIPSVTLSLKTIGVRLTNRGKLFYWFFWFFEEYLLMSKWIINLWSCLNCITNQNIATQNRLAKEVELVTALCLRRSLLQAGFFIFYFSAQTYHKKLIWHEWNCSTVKTSWAHTWACLLTCLQFHVICHNFAVRVFI